MCVYVNWIKIWYNTPKIRLIQNIYKINRKKIDKCKSQIIWSIIDKIKIDTNKNSVTPSTTKLWLIYN